MLALTISASLLLRSRARKKVLFPVMAPEVVHWMVTFNPLMDDCDSNLKRVTLPSVALVSGGSNNSSEERSRTGKKLW